MISLRSIKYQLWLILRLIIQQLGVGDEGMNATLNFFPLLPRLSYIAMFKERALKCPYQ